MLRSAREVFGLALLMFLAVAIVQAAPVELSRQSITLPANASPPLFADVDGDGRSDLLAIDPVQKKLLSYHQRPHGFTNSPDQVIPLPPQTAWVTVCDVDVHPGLELLMSTATGLLYSRQNAGQFESERRTLIEANQIFTNSDIPILTSLSTNQPANRTGTNDLIPVITATQAVQYHRNTAYKWTPGPPLALGAKQTAWHASREQWTLGSNPAHSLNVQQSFRSKPDQKRDEKPENETIRKIVDDMKKHGGESSPIIERVDLDGDGREDLVLWEVSGKLDFNYKTDIYIFLRGADGQLPDRPTQTLHCRGFAIPFGANNLWSPVHDLNGDGVYELVLLELRTVFTSPSSLVQTALSHGVDLSLTVRSFQHGLFSRDPDASVPVTILLTLEDSATAAFCVQGDFNGDGLPDLLVRRSDTQWNIFFSTTGGRWFAPQPAMTFDAPANGYLEVKDLNGDGLADMIWHDPDEARLSIFLSPSRRAAP